MGCYLKYFITNIYGIDINIFKLKIWVWYIMEILIKIQNSINKVFHFCIKLPGYKSSTNWWSHLTTSRSMAPPSLELQCSPRFPQNLRGDLFSVYTGVEYQNNVVLLVTKIDRGADESGYVPPYPSFRSFIYSSIL